jgi:DNA-binding response OmpR family regulator
MRVLLALSEEASRSFSSEFFKALGWSIESTGDPSTAVHLATFRTYDAVVADLQFDRCQCTAGLQIVRAAKRRHARSVVVLLSTSQTRHHAGEDGFFLKPLSLGRIAQFICAQWAQTLPKAGGNVPAARRELGH